MVALGNKQSGSFRGKFEGIGWFLGGFGAWGALESPEVQGKFQKKTSKPLRKLILNIFFTKIIIRSLKIIMFHQKHFFR